MRHRCHIGFAGLLMSACFPVLSFAIQQTPPTTGVIDPDQAPEEAIITQLRHLEAIRQSQAKPEELTLRTVALEEIVADADALLKRFPQSAFRDQALIGQVNALAELARYHPDYLDRLLTTTADIDKQKPTGRLAAENAFAAIQGFVLGARRENIPEDKRLAGVGERYGAFLADFPNSPRVPVIRASFVRTLIALGTIDRAGTEFEKLRRDHPNDPATRRAAGELFRATGVGQPFAFSAATIDGKTFRSADVVGKVLLVHFWSASEAATSQEIQRLTELKAEFGERGLQLLGVDVDKSRDALTAALAQHKADWPQVFDGKGFEGELVVSLGVIQLPTYLLVDRKGVLRAVPTRDQLRDAVKSAVEPPSGGK